MIAIDTNVLLRYLIQDDEAQAKKAVKLITGKQKVLVTDVVLTETIWVLKGKRYQLSKEKIVDVIHALFAETNIQFEDGQAVWCALKDYMNAAPIKVKGKTKQADFPDALIVNKAKRYGQMNNMDVSPIYTFDKAALEIDGTQEP
ncbi:type II toxin-antitoxin system VapC family toxin [Thalassomonas viridans]|uniref:Type II toxin-antitoxin system VapC family toxin n=1 Tax=Thalassomonas viridans TaxID=137584 RepID=A0AAE9Z4W5_9GAMM|nr:type II toxin-antitoxin system VapC family toxin [Thalassomonas viridans]WDE06663.1 type II toxin-antitoxin system VapC family toxin [Thalassomonas viridans]